LLGAQLKGDRLSFHFEDASRVLHSFKAAVSGAVLEGEVVAQGVTTATSLRVKAGLR
jgi:hypothetical protein